MARGKAVKFYTDEDRREAIKAAAAAHGMDYEEFVLRAAEIAESHPQRFKKLSRGFDSRRE